MSNPNSGCSGKAEHSPLGKVSCQASDYDPNLLFPITRDEKRRAIGIQSTQLPFYGVDTWNHYEVSWLTESGKPAVAVAVIQYDCSSPMMVESKSLKLYFNSLNNTVFQNANVLQNIISQDLSTALQTSVTVSLIDLQTATHEHQINTSLGFCLDDIDVTCEHYTPHPQYLRTTSKLCSETLVSHLLRSNCLVTHQPDWGSVIIEYEGPQIDHAGLLQYLISFRQHNEFHEQCIERIFVDIMQQCQPIKLSIMGRYTRRGGIDINPYRSTEIAIPSNHNQRLCRQ